ncbi:MAG TPA: metallophosphoesterase [Woeseiaceae bacterium]|nr:metallophosphoesterase [Woeseiaceae bacterium]
MNASQSLRSRLFSISLLLFLLLSAAGARAADWRWSGVERIVAVGDVHGAYDSLVRTLGNAGILDGENRWAAGAAHLVVTGDMLDRGPDSRRVMDLLMRLEGEAVAAGGRVHVLLGNHEVMNLVGDLRYVSAAEYAAFADEESPAERARGLEVFSASRAGTLDEAALKAEFAKRAPPGFFAHRRAFAPDGRYGRWLLEKPFIVVINDTAFVHGGLSSMVTELGLEGINGGLKAELASYARFVQELTDAGVLDATENFYRRAALLQALPEDPQRSADIEAALAGVVALQDAAIHHLDSPVWYRGNVACSALIESDKLDAALERIGAARVVIGHTPTITGELQLRLGGRVVEIDTGMLAAAYGGSGHALVIEGGRLHSIGEASSEPTAPVPQPRYAGKDGSALSATELEHVLDAGEIPAVRDGAGQNLVEVRAGGASVSALVVETSGDEDFAPEVAAWRVDRMLNLGMVPVAVARDIEGDAGVLQWLPAGTIDEAVRRERGEGGAAWCPLPQQWNAMYVFDTLIGNSARRPQSMLYQPNDWELLLVSHGGAFSTDKRRPRYLEEVDLQPGPAWVKALESLTDERLEAELGDVLDGKRLRAMAARRDRLLANAAEREPASDQERDPPQ